MEESNTPQRKPLKERSTIEIIEQCGRLKYPVKKVISILRSENKTHVEEMEERLTTPGTEEYKAYHSGVDTGDFDVESALMNVAATGDPAAQETLHGIQRERAINDAIKEKFFPDEDS